MKCNKCNADNRDIAIFCKKCGNKLASATTDPFDGIIGREDVKEAIARYICNVNNLRSRGISRTVECDTIIMGASGTGKSHLAQAITKALFDAGVVKHPKPTVVDAVDWAAFAKDWDNNIQAQKDHVLVIDNVQKLVEADDNTKVGKLDKLFHAMDGFRGNPVVILLGLPAGFREFWDKNADKRRYFENFFNLQEYSAKELTAIIARHLLLHYGMGINPEAVAKVERVVKHVIRHKPDDWGNAYSALRMADDMNLRAVNRGASEVEPCDVAGTEERDLSAEEILAKLDDFVGIDNIKSEIRNMIYEIEYDKERFGKEPEIRSHFVFTGNPGTGKTTIARIFADILKAMKVLPVGQLIEADRSKLVAGTVGNTAIQTNELVDRAMGGILFIDEAYTLVTDAGSGAGFGQEAVDTLLKRLEDDRGKFVCIVAGYTKEMFDFLQANPGMKSRFNKVIEFKDYDGSALAEMFRARVKKEGFMLDASAEGNINNFFDSIYATRTKNFGNAREVRNIFDEAKRRQSTRLRAMRDAGNYTPQDALVLTRDDIEGDESTRQLNLDDVMARMEREFVGMTQVKDAMRAMGKKMAAKRKRIELGVGDPSPIHVHIKLTGNPGTGKTTVARTLGRMLKAIRVLPTDNVIEVDKSSMVVGYVGQTPDNVNRLVDRALGGILFVDEAYTLAQDDFGKQAIETLMKRMEDDRGKFVCILAGYRNEMDEFMRVNPGIQSRITHHIHIEDYSAAELLQIFKNMVTKEKLRLTPEADKLAARAVDEIVSAKSKDFGNAREMRRLLDKTIDRQSARIDALGDSLTTDILTTIEAEDIPVEKAKEFSPDEILARLNSLVGLTEVKKEVAALADSLTIAKMRAEAEGKTMQGAKDHYLFLGNPGTGKTTVARIMADVFLQLGVTKNTKFVEASYDTLVSKYVGETPEKTGKVIDSAMGGILFIDEAYTLNQGPNSPGQMAIDTLLKRMEDDRGKFVCIAAGYSREMSEFIATNSGLKSRFNKTIHFEDYDADALAEIFRRKAAAENFAMSPESDAAMVDLMRKTYANRTANFGNAREVNNIFSKVKEHQGSRIIAIMRQGSRPTPADLFSFTPEDFMTL